MSGSRLRFILHDGKKVVDDRAIPRKFHGMNVPDATKILYNLTDKDIKKYETGELAGKEEIISINGITKKGKDGFQVYLALMKGGEVLKMGLSADPNDNGRFLNAGDMQIDLDKLESYLQHLPNDVELAVVWRYDKGMTQDILLTQNSMIGQIVPAESPNQFSLLDRQPPIGCGGGFGGDAETVYDLTEVLIYTGEEDNPIRMSNIVMAAPPEVSSWDPSDSSDYLYPVVSGTLPRRKAIESATDSSTRMCWQDELKPSGMSIEPITFDPYTDTPEANNETPPTTAPKTVILLVCDESPKQDIPKPQEYKPDDNPILRLLMNPTERKLWGKLYGLPDDEIQKFPVQRITRKEEKTIPVRLPKAMVLGFKRLKLPRQAAMTQNKQPKARVDNALKPLPLLPPPVPKARISKQKPDAPARCYVPAEYKAPKTRPVRSAPRPASKVAPAPVIKPGRKSKAPKARQKKKRTLEKPLAVRRKTLKHEPELKARKKSAKPKLPEIRKKKVRALAVVKPKERKRKTRAPAVKQKAPKKTKPSLKAKKPSKKKPWKGLHSYFKNEMLGLSARKKPSGRARAGSSL